MKKNIPFLILLILPLVLILISIFLKYSIGEYYLYRDPSYVYLFNSLNLSQLSGFGVGHIDHPGSTLQMAGAIVIKVCYFLQGRSADIVQDVLQRPEFYLERINIVIVIIIAAALYILGFTLYRKSGNIFSALFLQLTPFCSVTIYFDLINISPEIFLILTALVLITTLIIYTDEAESSTPNNFKYSIIFGLICGFGLATKISFFPILVIPFILLKRIPNKIYFLFASFTAFILFVSPVISFDQILYFAAWIKSIVTHTGLYGQGSDDFVIASSFAGNIKKIFFNEPVFTIAYILILLTIVLRFLPKNKNQLKGNIYFNLLTGIFIAMNIQLIIVAKHFTFRYMTPALMFSIPAIYIVYKLTVNMLPEYIKKKKAILIFIILLISSFYSVKNYLSITSTIYYKQTESHKTEEYIDKNFKQSIVIGTNMSSYIEAAYFQAARHSGTQREKYFAEIQNMFPDRYCYNIFYKDIELTDKKKLKTELIKAGKFIFYCRRENELNDFIYFLKEKLIITKVKYGKVYSNERGETIYEFHIAE
ncbi:MAG: hypothetical protein IPM38_01250 [Ignavibacteria bacterium]|nr:hypothetical protein [Ignavibacteria bacterium]